jgi:hypothetical protein
MEPHSSPPEARDALDAFIDELLATTAPLMTAIEHMRRWRAAGPSAPGSPAVTDVLATLLRDVLAKVADRHPPAKLDAAAALLAEVGEVVGEELMLVPLDAGAAHSTRRSRRPRRRG